MSSVCVLVLNWSLSLTHLHTHVIGLHASVLDALVLYKARLLSTCTHTHTHRCRHTLEHREASLAHGLHMAKPTFIRARASVNMCACVCHSDTKALPDMAEGISISVSSSLPSPADLFDTHTHTYVHTFFFLLTCTERAQPLGCNVSLTIIASGHGIRGTIHQFQQLLPLDCFRK